MGSMFSLLLITIEADSEPGPKSGVEPGVKPGSVYLTRSEALVPVRVLSDHYWARAQFYGRLGADFEQSFCGQPQRDKMCPQFTKGFLLFRDEQKTRV